MISRRTFSFASLVLFVSRWRIFGQSQSQPQRQLSYDELLRLMQTDPSRVMMKNENENARIFTAPAAGYRVEYLKEHKIFIVSKRLNKLLILNLDKKTYREEPLRPFAGKGTITYSVSHPTDSEIYNLKPKPLPLLEVDPQLFEVPPGFKHAEK